MATSSNDKNNNASYPPPQNNPPNGHGGYSGGASYPYPSPLPPSSYPTTFYQQPPTTFMYQQSPAIAVANSVRCSFLSFITTIIILIGIILLISYFVFKPRVPEFRIDSASLTSFNLTNTQLSAKWDINLIVSNPNKKLEISYDAIAASVFYDGSFGPLASTHVAPFYQPTKSTTMVRVQFEAVNEFVDNIVANGIVEGRVRGIVQFGVVLNTLIKLNGLFHPSDHLFKVICQPLNFGISSNFNNATTTWVLLRDVTCD